MTLSEVNNLDNNKAFNWFESCCASKAWCMEMIGSRPFNSIDSMHQKAQSVWHNLGEKDYLQAFEAHPMIGDLKSLKQKYASTSAVASQEQSGTSQANEQTLLDLQRLNKKYLDKNGFIFIICATGLSADQMLNALTKRITNSRAKEVQIAATQQLMITKIRMNKLLNVTEQGAST